MVSFEIGSRIYPPKLLLMRDMRSNLVQKEELRISDGVESLFIENQEKTKRHGEQRRRNGAREVIVGKIYN